MALNEITLIFILFLAHSYATIIIYAKIHGIKYIWNNHYNMMQIKYCIACVFISYLIIDKNISSENFLLFIVLIISISMVSVIFIFQQKICAGLIITNSTLSVLIFTSIKLSQHPNFYIGYAPLFISSAIALYRIFAPDDRFKGEGFLTRLVIAIPCATTLVLSVHGLASNQQLQNELLRLTSTTGSPSLPYQTFIMTVLLPVASLLTLASVPLITASHLHKSIKAQFKELIETREQLEKALSEQQKTAAMLSHEFCGPLASISAACQLIEYSGKLYDKELYNEIDRIKRTTNRLAQLSENWLTDGFTGPSTSRTITAAASLREVLSELSTEYQCTLHPPSTNTKIAGDQNTLFIAFSSIIENARKYSGPDGTIEIWCETHSKFKNMMKVRKTVAVYISDNGPGLTPGEEKRIFNKHYRSPRNKDKNGNGMGLYIAKSCIESLNGKIHACNNNKKYGCTFKVVLPIK